MALQLWTISNLQRLEYSIRKKIVFYAPLTEHLDFYGVEPVTYSWSGTGPVTYRGGVRTITGPAPAFNFSGETPFGIYVNTGVTLQFSAANGLNNANTLVWFENRVPKSTPTNANPFNSSGVWTGNQDLFVSHIAKANAVLANSEINAIQAALLDVIQTIPIPPAPPAVEVGSFVNETPSGARNGSNTSYTLSFTPDPDSLIVAWAGLFLKQVGSSPAALQYTVSGTTLTLGSAPLAEHDLTAQYVTA